VNDQRLASVIAQEKVGEVLESPRLSSQSEQKKSFASLFLLKQFLHYFGSVTVESVHRGERDVKS